MKQNKKQAQWSAQIRNEDEWISYTFSSMIFFLTVDRSDLFDQVKSCI